MYAQVPFVAPVCQSYSAHQHSALGQLHWWRRNISKPPARSLPYHVDHALYVQKARQADAAGFYFDSSVG